MRARTIEGLDPSAPLAGNVRRILAVRVAELYSFVPAALEESQPAALHDMRIAAKRLRYLLEIAGFCCGDYADRALEHAKALHDLLGEVHDCDVFLPRLEALAERTGEGGEMLRDRYVALRHERFLAFRAHWARVEAEQMAERLQPDTLIAR